MPRNKIIEVLIRALLEKTWCTILMNKEEKQSGLFDSCPVIRFSNN